VSQSLARVGRIKHGKGQSRAYDAQDGHDQSGISVAVNGDHLGIRRGHSANNLTQAATQEFQLFIGDTSLGIYKRCAVAMLPSYLKKVVNDGQPLVRFG